jgi:hypothetical protein
VVDGDGCEYDLACDIGQARRWGRVEELPEAKLRDNKDGRFAFWNPKDPP